MIRVKTRIPINDLVDAKVLGNKTNMSLYTHVWKEHVTLECEYAALAVLDVDAFMKRCENYVFLKQCTDTFGGVDREREPFRAGPMSVYRIEELCEQSTQSH